MLYEAESERAVQAEAADDVALHIHASPHAVGV
jgi:hypothetical protein